MKKISMLMLTLMAVLIISETAYARGRSGSRRVYSGHGKGSHYVGGR